MNKGEQVARLMLKTTPEERRKLFSRVDALHSKGVYLPPAIVKEMERYKEVKRNGISTR